MGGTIPGRSGPEDFPALANITQQKKRIRIAERQRAENTRYRSTIKTLFKSLEASAAGDDAADTTTRARELEKLVDRAAARGAIHKNTASRKKSRIARITTPAEAPEAVSA